MNTITKAIKFTMPSQNVRCPPRKKIEMLWNFFSYTDTIDYLIDFELDEEKPFFKAKFPFVFYIYHPFFNLDIDTATKLSQQNYCFSLKSFNYTEPYTTASGDEVTLLKTDSRLLLKNIPLQVRIDGHHGQFNTHEKDL